MSGLPERLPNSRSPFEEVALLPGLNGLDAPRRVVWLTVRISLDARPHPNISPEALDGPAREIGLAFEG
ncbi:MAG: hypothetical protein K8H88_27350, partial [Sandaracinaceae bacterium]|nr:hypothetical protein [Sandaracinaceae bacterium]